MFEGVRSRKESDEIMKRQKENGAWFKRHREALGCKQAEFAAYLAPFWRNESHDQKAVKGAPLTPGGAHRYLSQVESGMVAASLREFASHQSGNVRPWLQEQRISDIVAALGVGEEKDSIVQSFRSFYPYFALVESTVDKYVLPPAVAISPKPESRIIKVSPLIYRK